MALRNVQNGSNKEMALSATNEAGHQNGLTVTPYDTLAV